MRTAVRAALVLTFAAITFSGPAAAEEPLSPFDEARSGYFFARPETRAIQDDDFANPGLLWVEAGEEAWSKIEGAQERSCATCHGDATESMRGVATAFPKIDPSSKSLVNLEQKINLCRVRNMKVIPYEQESEALLSMSAYVTRQSTGLLLSVRIDGDAAPWFERGKDLYHERVGQMSLACTQCHDQQVGNYLRAEHISQGQINGFPTYLLRWGKLASVHRRFQFCNEQARAEPLPIGSDDYNALQLYVGWRGTGIPVEAPAVRR